MQKADIERRRRGKKDILQLTDWAVFFLFFLILLCFVSYHQISLSWFHNFRFVVLVLVLRVSVSVSMREPKFKVFESPKEGASSLEMKPKKCSSRIYTLVWKEFPSKSFAIKKKEKPLFLLRAIHLMQRLILKNRPLAVLPNRAKWYSIHMVHMLEFSFFEPHMGL